jgi:hypothetical protein
MSSPTQRALQIIGPQKSCYYTSLGPLHPLAYGSYQRAADFPLPERQGRPIKRR